MATEGGTAFLVGAWGPFVTLLDICQPPQQFLRPEPLSRREFGQARYSVWSDEFLNKVRTVSGKDLAAELLVKTPKGQINARQRTSPAQTCSFADLLERALRRYHNGTIEAAHVIEEFMDLARQLPEAETRGERLGFRGDDLGYEQLKEIARELVERVRNRVTIDCALREDVRARLRVLVRRTPRSHGYPPT